MKKTKIALVGFGGMGEWHCNLIGKIEELELAGIYDISKERSALAREKGIHVYETLEELLEDASVELVTVAIPNQLHKDMCIRLMAAGKHVVCEKPVALNHQELQEMIDDGEDIEMKCHFCNSAYVFTIEDLKGYVAKSRA